MFKTIHNKTIEKCTRLKFNVLTKLKKNKTRTTREYRLEKCGQDAQKETQYPKPKKKMINEIDNNKSGFTPSALKTRRGNEHGLDRFKNVAVFSFSMTILLRCTKIGKLR